MKARILCIVDIAVVAKMKERKSSLKEFQIFCLVFVNMLKICSDVIASASLEFIGNRRDHHEIYRKKREQ